MNKVQKDRLLRVVYVISALLVLTGAFLKLQHYANGDLFLLTGFISGSLISEFEIYGLKKIIKEFEKVKTE